MTAKLAHFEISAPNDGALVDFYAQLLGWSIDRRGPGYTLVHPDDGPAGAIVESAESRITLGVTVDDLDILVSRVVELGGQLLMPPTDNGWVIKALIADPAGNTVSLIQDQSPTDR